MFTFDTEAINKLTHLCDSASQKLVERVSSHAGLDLY